MSKHLHRDYHTSFCGKDASHISMTYEEGETDCQACLKAAGAAAEKAVADTNAIERGEAALIAAAEAARIERTAIYEGSSNHLRKVCEVREAQAAAAAIAARYRHP